MYAEKQESLAHSQGKKKKIRTVPKESQTLDLLDKDFKPAALNTLTELTSFDHGQRAKGNQEKDS